MNSPALDLTPFHQVLASLEDGLDVVRDTSWFNQQNDKVRHTLIAGVIQNFEFVYEISTKMLRRRLEMDALNPSEVDFASSDLPWRVDVVDWATTSPEFQSHIAEHSILITHE
ncbi:MAG: nucleotidyltransferase substrate binding protein [Limnohabitans sp.]|nr:nucleotidyltransferase substrate binding protein [Limnohabitans sp.]